MVSEWFQDIDVLVQQVSSPSSPVTWNRKKIEDLVGVGSSTARRIGRALAGGRNANTPKNAPHSVPQKKLLDFLVEFQKILNVSSAGLTATEFSKRKRDAIDQAQKRLKQILDSGALRPLRQIASTLQTVEIGSGAWVQLEQEGQPGQLSPREVAENVIADWARKRAARMKKSQGVSKKPPKPNPAAKPANSLP